MGWEQFTDALEQKADTTALPVLKEMVATKASLDQLAEIGTRKADRHELAAVLQNTAALRARLDEQQHKAVEMETRKADSLEVKAALRGKADLAALEAGLAKIAEIETHKADRTEVAEALARKAELAAVEQLAVDKANLEQLASLEASKADRHELAAALQNTATLVARLDEQQRHALELEARKADSLEVTAALGGKADLAALETGLARIAEIETHKADRTEVEEALARKAELAAVEQLAVDKANLEQLASLEASKANHSEVSGLNDRKADREELAAAVRETATLLARLDEQQRHAQGTMHDHKLRTLDIERRLGLLLEEARKRLPEPLTKQQIRTLTGHLKGLDAAMYAQFEDIFRGTREDIKGRQSIYLPYLSKTPGTNVLDLGCGRGEFLELLLDNNYTATGVDLSPVMVRRCQDLSLPAQQGDVIEFLRSQRARAYGAVTAFHIVEHLPTERLLGLLDEALRVLRRGGLLILETPNPRNMIVGACDFYIDPTHLSPLPPQLLQFLVEDRGFVDVAVLPLHPVPDYQRPKYEGLPEFLTDLLFGPQDYGIVATKA